MAESEKCNCEHRRCGHAYGGVEAGKHRARYVGAICDRCAETHMAEYVIPETDSTERSAAAEAELERCRETDACMCAACQARKFGQSEPELAARITAAKAALGDYRRETSAWLSTGNYQPDFASWAERFAADLAGIVGHIERLAQ